MLQVLDISGQMLLAETADWPRPRVWDLIERLGVIHDAMDPERRP